MMHSLSILILLIVTAITAVVYAEPPVDISLGRIKMRNTAKLDGKARSDVAAIAKKIKKMRALGVVKLRGDFTGAETEAEYLLQSVFMATEVEAYLQTLLSAKFQVFVAASVYSGVKRSAGNSVEILLYPPQVRLEELESLRFVSTRITPSPAASSPDAAVKAVPQAEKAGEGGLLSSPREDDDVSDTASKMELEKRTSEDAALANELVLKAKLRAAERAKRRAADN